MQTRILVHVFLRGSSEPYWRLIAGFVLKKSSLGFSQNLTDQNTQCRLARYCHKTELPQRGLCYGATT